MLQYGQVTDAPTYLEDKSLLGVCNGFTIPEMESRTIEHDTLGSVGILMLPARGLSGLSGSIKLMFPEPDMVSMFARPNKAAKFQVHQKIDVFDADGLNEEKSTTLITHVKALFNKSAFAEVKILPCGDRDDRHLSGTYHHTRRALGSDRPSLLR